LAQPHVWRLAALTSLNLGFGFARRAPPLARRLIKAAGVPAAGDRARIRPCGRSTHAIEKLSLGWPRAR
jgi:hypothetical protein